MDSQKDQITCEAVKDLEEVPWAYLLVLARTAIETIFFHSFKPIISFRVYFNSLIIMIILPILLMLDFGREKDILGYHGQAG